MAEPHDIYTECCANCKYFRRHYVLDMFNKEKNAFWPLDQGHCVYPRMKHRHIDDLCAYFEPTAEIKQEKYDMKRAAELLERLRNAPSYAEVLAQRENREPAADAVAE